MPQAAVEHVRLVPDGEREEIRQIFAAKGFSGHDLERAVAIITSEPHQWVDTMLREELGLALEAASPWRAAATTFLAFVIVGSAPLLSFLYRAVVPSAPFNPFVISIALTAAAIFFVGAIKSRFVNQRWYFAGMETLAIGGAAAAMAFAVGVALKGVGVK